VQDYFYFKKIESIYQPYKCMVDKRQNATIEKIRQNDKISLWGKYDKIPLDK